MYTFTNTEINNKKASEFETKSMLYLLGMRNDSDEIDLITVDCFNDVTGSNEEFTKLWDVQSKNHNSLPPSKIGASLFTLYDNFISSIDFFEYILFIPKLRRDYLVDDSLNIYRYENIKPKQKNGIEKKLIETINKNTSGKRPPLFQDFLNSVTFVEDNQMVSTYIKNLSKFRNKRSASEELYESIFKEIRDAQSGLKNSYIENETIKHPSDVLRFNRHITKLQINTMIINRLVGIDVFSARGVPIPFIPFIDGLEIEEITDLIQDCNANLSRAFFDKNGCKNFWEISEEIVGIIKNNVGITVEQLYLDLMAKVQVKTLYLSENTILYMISLIKEGFENES